jgi:DNA polymerase I-like protein with 3'-5' exonuclease and polymerase domains
MRPDASGLFWHDEPDITRSGSGIRPVPPIPETGWILPDSYPSLEGQGAIAIDVETYDPELKTRGPGAFRDGKLVGVSIGTEAGFRRYYPIAHEMGENLPKEKVIQWLRRELKRTVPKIGANLLYDLAYFAAEDIEVTGPYYDVQVAEPLLNENRLSYSLENLARDWLKEGKVQNVMKEWLVRAFGETNYKANIYRAPATVVGPYAEGDVDLPLRVFALQRRELESRGIWNLFLLESRLIPLLLAMWRRGVRVDLDKAEQLYKKLAGQQVNVIAEIKRVSGIEPDIWAADSLAQIFDAAGIPYLYTEKTGKPSFRKEWLAACTHPVGQLVMEARRLDKFKGTFVKGYILDGNVNGRIHCQFHPLRSDDGGTVSGRFSSSHPNLQNIPIRDPELGPLIRSIFIAELGQRWWKFDWSQIEFRLAIHHAARMKLKGAQAIVDQYMTDPTTDYHKVVATITGLARSAAKNLNFGIIYGLGIEAMAQTLGVDIDTATRMYREYLRRVPFIGQLRNKAMNHASRTGIIETLSGRQRHFDVWEKGGQYFYERVKGAKRAFTHKALNARLQGDAADIMKTAMADSWDAGVFDYIGAPHLTVHDELDGSENESPAALEALAELKHIMETCVPLSLPLRADGGTGLNWGAIE